jgi:hypothetical protein
MVVAFMTASFMDFEVIRKEYRAKAAPPIHQLCRNMLWRNHRVVAYGLVSGNGNSPADRDMRTIGSAHARTPITFTGHCLGGLVCTFNWLILSPFLWRAGEPAYLGSISGDIRNTRTLLLFDAAASDSMCPRLQAMPYCQSSAVPLCSLCHYRRPGGLLAQYHSLEP